MEALHITGGKRLIGSVAVGGSKNAALPILAASILTDEAIRLQNVPRLLDVDRMALLLGHLGVEVAYERDHLAAICLRDSRPTTAPARLVRAMRASFCVLGPLLARRGKARVPLPGGCRIGARPVDVHLRGLAALGAEIMISRGCVLAKAKRLRCATIDLLGPHGSTVTGTANVLCAAVLARGVSVLTNAAREPEIEDLCRFLNSLGARISGLGSSELTIRGVEQLGGCSHAVMPDRIEATTWLAAAAITGGCISLTDVDAASLQTVLATLQEAGCRTDCRGLRIEIDAPAKLRPFRFEAEPHPGLPTDAQAMFTALATKAEGRSHISDRVFPERFRHVRQLRRMGAAIRVRGGRVVVDGGRPLVGCQVAASDLRAAAALGIAGLAAEGETVVRGLQHLDRGYENFAEKLRGLGAGVERVRISRHRELPV